MDHHTLEEGTTLNLDFKKLKKVANCGEDIIPAVAQDANIMRYDCWLRQ